MCNVPSMSFPISNGRNEGQCVSISRRRDTKPCGIAWEQDFHEVSVKAQAEQRSLRSVSCWT